MEREQGERFSIAHRVFLQELTKQVAKESGKPLIIDDQISRPLDMFVMWVTGNIDGMRMIDVDPRKGVLLRGNVGSGKSILFRTLRSLLKHDEYRPLFRPLRFTTCEAVAKQFMAEGDKYIEQWGNRAVIYEYGKPVLKNVCFDDLGTEEPKNHYGNFREVMKDIITERYDHFVDHGLITCFTTNLTMDEIEKRYDRRVRSRLEQMCNVIGIGSNKDTYIDRRLK